MLHEVRLAPFGEPMKFCVISDFPRLTYEKGALGNFDGPIGNHVTRSDRTRFCRTSSFEGNLRPSSIVVLIVQTIRVICGHALYHC